MIHMESEGAEGQQQATPNTCATCGHMHKEDGVCDCGCTAG